MRDIRIKLISLEVGGRLYIFMYIWTLGVLVVHVDQRGLLLQILIMALESVRESCNVGRSRGPSFWLVCLLWLFNFIVAVYIERLVSVVRLVVFRNVVDTLGQGVGFVQHWMAAYREILVAFVAKF